MGSPRRDLALISTAQGRMRPRLQFPHFSLFRQSVWRCLCIARMEFRAIRRDGAQVDRSRSGARVRYLMDSSGACHSIDGREEESRQ